MMRLISGLFAALVISLPVAAGNFTEGVHYTELFQKQPVVTGAKIEVRELFWYGCPHCFDLEPELYKWRKSMPANAAFVRMPAVLRDSWAPHARAYYAFEALGVTDKLHSALFEAIHAKKEKINDAAALADFVARHGVKKQAFLDAYNSFGVDSEFRKAQVLGRQYEADGVPTIIVDGRYRTTASMAGSHATLMQVVNSLIEKAARERAAK